MEGHLHRPASNQQRQHSQHGLRKQTPPTYRVPGIRLSTCSQSRLKPLICLYCRRSYPSVKGRWWPPPEYWRPHPMACDRRPERQTGRGESYWSRPESWQRLIHPPRWLAGRYMPATVVPGSPNMNWRRIDNWSWRVTLLYRPASCSRPCTTIFSCCSCNRSVEILTQGQSVASAELMSTRAVTSWNFIVRNFHCTVLNHNLSGRPEKGELNSGVGRWELTLGSFIDFKSILEPGWADKKNYR